MRRIETLTTSVLAVILIGSTSSFAQTFSPQNRPSDHLDSLLQRFDENRDGLLSPSEMPSWATNRFSHFDRNRDGFVDQSERQSLIRQAEQVSDPGNRRPQLQRDRAQNRNGFLNHNGLQNRAGSARRRGGYDQFSRGPYGNAAPPNLNPRDVRLREIVPRNAVRPGAGPQVELSQGIFANDETRASRGRCERHDSESDARRISNDGSRLSINGERDMRRPTREAWRQSARNLPAGNVRVRRPNYDDRRYDSTLESRGPLNDSLRVPRERQSRERRPRNGQASENQLRDRRLQGERSQLSSRSSQRHVGAARSTTRGWSPVGVDYDYDSERETQRLSRAFGLDVRKLPTL